MDRLPMQHEEKGKDGMYGINVKQNAINVYDLDMIPYSIPEQEQEVVNT